MASLPLQESVASFRKLYDEVTKSLEEFRDHDNELAHDNDAKNWLQYLIDNFEDRYKAWQAPPNPDLNQYLNALGDKNTDQVVRLAGYVYLHIGLDLPIVIANALAEHPGTGGRKAPKIGINTARTIYLKVAPSFAAVLHNHKFSFKEGFRLWLFSKPWPFRSEAVHILVYWILTLRSVAWIHGEYIFSEPVGKGHFNPEAAMLKAMNQALQHALQSTWLSVLRHLQPPTLYGAASLMMGSIFPFSFFNAFPLWLQLVVLFTTIVVIGMIWKVYRYRRLNLRLELFSREIYRAVTSAVLGNEYTPMEDTRNRLRQR